VIAFAVVAVVLVVLVMLRRARRGTIAAPVVQAVQLLGERRGRSVPSRLPGSGGSM
jgi:preprotein translocase subunit SecG